jgi:hydroxypyruvate isomerase
MGFAITMRYKGLPIHIGFPWKITIVSAMAYPRIAQDKSAAAEDLPKVLNDPFFDSVEIPSIDESTWQALAKYVTAKKTILSLQPNILANKLDMSSLDSSQRKQSTDRIKREIEAAANHGIGLACVCSGSDPGANKRADARNNLIESLVEVCEFAHNKQVRIALETFDRDFDKKLLIGPLDEAIEVVTRVKARCDNIGLMWDLSHAPMLGETPKDLKRAAPFLEHIHVGCAKKNDGTYVDTHPVFYTKGAVNSERDVEMLLNMLLSVDYRGMIGFEVKPEADQTSEEIIAISKGVLMSAYQRIVASLLS